MTESFKPTTPEEIEAFWRDMSPTITTSDEEASDHLSQPGDIVEGALVEAEMQQLVEQAPGEDR